MDLATPSIRPVMLPLAILAAMGLGVGCGPVEKAPFQPVNVEPYASLKQSLATQNARLRDELARIESAGGTPLLLDAEVPADRDLAPKLLAILPAAEHKKLSGEIDRLWPRGRFSMSPHERQQTVDTLDRHRARLDECRDLLKQPNLAFRFPFKQGLFGDTSFVEAARIAARLEGLAAADTLLRLEAPRLGDAIMSLDHMLEWSARIAQVKHPIPRLTAADLRAGALAILESIVSHSQLAPKELLQLHSLVERERTRWPADSDAWIGERAVALHTYEMIRDGQLLSFLSIDEISRARKKGSIHALGQAVAANLQYDESFYLAEMSTVLAACRQPFHERAALLRDLERKVRSLEETPEYPYVAATILLPSLSAGHRRQAEDQAHLLLWSVALNEAIGQPSSTELTDPTNGLPYVVAREETRVVVRRPGRAGESERAAIVPILDLRSARRP